MGLGGLLPTQNGEIQTMPDFTHKQVELITRSLPDRVDRQRLKLLPQILREWASVELRNHLEAPSTTDRKRLIKQLKAVGTYARKLTQVLNVLHENSELLWIIDGSRSQEN
jgi:hypothetical protein